MWHRTRSGVQPATPRTFRLMDLPPDIRINIHIKVFDELPEAYIHTRSGKALACRSALPRVSRQVRNEFMPILYLYSHELVASVRDFNFGHVITFFNNLQDNEVKALPSMEGPLGRTMTVELKLVSLKETGEILRLIGGLKR